RQEGCTVGRIPRGKDDGRPFGAAKKGRELIFKLHVIFVVSPYQWTCPCPGAVFVDTVFGSLLYLWVLREIQVVIGYQANACFPIIGVRRQNVYHRAAALGDETEVHLA